MVDVGEEGDDLIETTLREIGKEYRPGLIRWIREESDRWNRLLLLEDRINQATLSKDDPGLKAALSAYKDFIMEMLKSFEMENSLPLFGNDLDDVERMITREVKN